MTCVISQIFSINSACEERERGGERECLLFLLQIEWKEDLFSRLPSLVAAKEVN